MAKLTDTQLIVLSTAAERDDGIAVVPLNINKAAASKVGSSLVARKLMREVRSKPGMPGWRQADDGRSISLMLTRAGRDAIGVDDGSVDEAPTAAKATTVTRAASSKKLSPEISAPWSTAVGGPRAGSKQAMVIGMLSSKAGATLDKLVEATGWLPHTTRAALTGLRKRGFTIERSSEKGGESVYRIVGAPAAAAA
ncbi:MAG: DUF3489 domain-containing protein [Beijerinckiaceae bacterium]|nr:MAG: DUF3489 domain-containing protein [Beijerinckiaceae bacterium]